MPIAAVPAYLGNDFTQASPGMRFGMFLPIWTTRQDQEADARQRAEARSREGQEVSEMLQRQGMDATISLLCQRNRNPLPGLWDKNDFAARNAWNNIKALGKADQERMKALADRQSALADTVPAAQLLRLAASAIAPFTTGLGNEHPLENGFAFLNPYGLPYLPGSGVKGVLRQAACELARGDWADTQGWSETKHYTIKVGKETVPLSPLDVLFGLESKDGDKTHVRGALTFWDVIPQIQGNSLMVEIMTPHQGHYYQNGQSPHDSGQPNPISFLTVPPGSGFAFHVQCDLAYLRRLAPELAEDGRWKTLLTAAFAHAFAWLGFGAKTAVGYGAMQRDVQAEAETLRKQQAAVADAAKKALSPNLQAVEDFKDTFANRAEQLKGKKEKPNTVYHDKAKKLANDAVSPGWTPDEKRAAAEAISEWLPKVVAVDMKDERKKLKLAALRGE